MKFPNAYKAVKKLFIAEILSLVIIVLNLVASVISAVVVINDSGEEALLLAAGGIILFTLFASIVVFIFQLIALIQGGKDESHFKVALFMVVIIILVNIASSILRLIDATKDINVLFTVLDAVTTVANVIVIVAILYSISSLADRLRDRKMSDKGSTLAVIIVLMFIASLIFDLVPTFFQGLNRAWEITFSIFGIAATIIQVLIYINIVIYYYKASKMLKRNE